MGKKIRKKLSKIIVIAVIILVVVGVAWYFTVHLRRNLANKIIGGEASSLAYSKAEILDPFNPAILIWQGDKAIREGNFRLAEKKYLAAKSQEKYAIALLFQDKTEEAEKILKEAGDLAEPVSNDFQKNLTAAKNPAEKLYYLKKEIARSPGQRDLWVMMAGVGNNLGNFELAEKYLETAESLDPTGTSIVIMKGELAVGEGKVPLAKEYFEKAKNLGAAAEELTILQKMIDEEEKNQVIGN